jgi:hypothetical protein
MDGPPIALAPGSESVAFVNPVGLVFTLLMCLLIVILPRRYAMLPVIALTCYMTMGMRIVFLGLNFTMLRILLLFGWTRLIVRRELKPLKLNPLDKTIVIWALVSILTYTLLWQSYDAFKNKLGLAYDALGFYFLFRFLLTDLEEIRKAFRIYAVLIVPLALCMIVEKMTGRDSFSVFGGVDPITAVRDGALRCQGPFAHPILAGTFGATLMPIFVGLWSEKKGRLMTALAIISAAIIMITSASSGPLLTFMLGILALSLWPLRASMRKIRWGIVIGLAGLQLVMKAPIWFILAKLDVVAGSTGYHRAYLIDRAIANFWGWWLVGTKSTWDWANRDSHLFDVTNQYIANGADGGLITMALFITIIVFGFKSTGRGIRLGERRERESDLRMLWACGAALFAHAATFISVAYFDQNFVNWYLLLAILSTCAGYSLLLSRQEFFEVLRCQQTAVLDTKTVLGRSRIASLNRKPSTFRTSIKASEDRMGGQREEPRADTDLQTRKSHYILKAQKDN